MKKTLGAELIQGLKEAIEHQKGTLKLREVIRNIKIAPTYKSSKIIQLRSRLGLSQNGLAKILCVSPRTVQSWEQGIRIPNRSVHRLLELIEKKPNTIFEILVFDK